MDYKYAQARASFRDSDQVVTSLPAPIPIRMLLSSTPGEVHHSHKQDVSIESVPELQPTLDYLTSLNQSPGPPPTPADSRSGYGYHQSNGIPPRLLSDMDQGSVIINSNTAPGCFCPANSCSCPRQHGLDQEQGQYLPPAAFEFDTPAKTLERRPIPEEWNPDELLADTSLGTDGFSHYWNE